MKNIKKVFMLVASLGFALGMASAAWGDDSSARISRIDSQTHDRAVKGPFKSVADKKQQELPDTITVDGVEYKKVTLSEGVRVWQPPKTRLQRSRH